jgi:hypothetical protein
MTTLATVTCEFVALAKDLDVAVRGTEHEAHNGWSLGGEPYEMRCACGMPVEQILTEASTQLKRLDQVLRLSGDEDCGVGLDCRLCDRGGAPIAYYSWPGDRTYEGTDVVRVQTITALLSAGREHLHLRHPE